MDKKTEDILTAVTYTSIGIIIGGLFCNWKQSRAAKKVIHEITDKSVERVNLVKQSFERLTGLMMEPGTTQEEFNKARADQMKFIEFVFNQPLI